VAGHGHRQLAWTGAIETNKRPQVVGALNPAMVHLRYLAVYPTLQVTYGPAFTMTGRRGLIYTTGPTSERTDKSMEILTRD
jgi:hypothetical protein